VLQAAGTSVGRVALAGAPEPGTEAHETMEHLLGIAALALEKALLYERSREQARRDSLTGLLAHQAFQEIPAILETPGADGSYVGELTLLAALHSRGLAPSGA